MTKIYLNQRSLENTGGSYGLVSSHLSDEFSETYVNYNELVALMQAKVNAEAQAMAEAADTINTNENVSVVPSVTTPWRVMFSLLQELNNL